MQDPYIHKTFSDYLLVDIANEISKTTKKWDHYHDFYEIYYYLGNEMNYFIDNEVYVIRNSDMIFIQPFLFHRTVYTSGNKRNRVLILFHPNLLEQMGMFNNLDFITKIKDLFLLKRKISFQSDESKKLLNNSVMNLYNVSKSTNSEYKEIKMQCALIELFILLLDLSFDEVYDKSKPSLSASEKHVYNAIKYINENYTADINLSTICDNIFISKYHLSHVFKEITGVTVVDFINSKRLSEAERLLRYSSLTITDIAQTVGFKSLSHFINLFKKNYKCTPSSFKKNLNT